jgi:pyruvate/2-oxoglutarate dehydrogenase complex dihydrolipoamide dehydrogenase (E3) component
VLLEAEAQRVTPAPGDKIDVTVRLSGARDSRTLTASHLFVATGRIPNSNRLNLAAAGVEVDERGFIRVNERLETSAPGICAIGDVKGGPELS